MSDDLDELLRPTVQSEPRAPGPKPWRVQSQFWVAFFGGIAAVTVIALLNAERLGIDRRRRWLMGAAGVVALAVLFAFWFRQPIVPAFAEYLKAGRTLRLTSRIIAVALFLLLAWLQRPAESHYLVFSSGEFASLWGAGITSSVILGSIQSPLLAWLAWIARQ